MHSTLKQQTEAVLAMPQAALLPRPVRDLLTSMVSSIDGLSNHVILLISQNERLEHQVQQLKTKI